MNQVKVPALVEKVLIQTAAIKFDMTSTPQVGCLLRTLVVSKPDGCFLEVGTGTGVSAAWMLDGMDESSQLMTVENDAEVGAIAQKTIGQDPRLTIHIEEGGTVIERCIKEGRQFNLIFADAWAGKYTHFEETMALLKVGGLYVIDDMLPQDNWPEGHEVKVAKLMQTLRQRSALSLCGMDWASGVIVAAKQAV